MSLNYHIGRLVLSSLCVGDLVRLVLVVFVLQASACKTFIYTKLKLKTCHTRRLSFKNYIGKMTVFLDAVLKPFF